MLAGQIIACPTVDDVKTGVRITFGDGTYSIISRDSAGAVTETQHTSDGEVFVFESANGLLETVYIEGDTQDTFAYDFDTSDLLPLTPWTRVGGQQTLTDKTGEVVERGEFSYHTLGESTYRIGACSYPAVSVQTHYQFDDGATMVELTFLTDLQIPINTAYRAGGVVDIYRAVSIVAE